MSDDDQNPSLSAFLGSLLDTAVSAADPMRCVPAALPEKPAGRVVVIGAGKASARLRIAGVVLEAQVQLEDGRGSLRIGRDLLAGRFWIEV